VTNGRRCLRVLWTIRLAAAAPRLTADSLLAVAPVIEANDGYPDRQSKEKQDVEKNVVFAGVISHDTELQNAICIGGSTTVDSKSLAVSPLIIYARFIHKT
jgi:hypothetical protein